MTWPTWWQIVAVLVALIADNAVLNICRTFGRKSKP